MKKVLSLILISCVMFFLGWLANGYLSKKNSTETKTDTFTVTRTDTVFTVKPIPYKMEVKDSVYLRLHDTVTVHYKDSQTISLPITQKYYDSDNYKAWISGYEPNLDSIITYDHTEMRTVVKEVEKRTTDFYITAENLMIKNTIAPNIGLSVKLKNNLILGGKIGYYDNGAYYGVNIGLKIN